MVKGKTKSGFKFEIEPNKMKDAEYLRLFFKVGKGDHMYFFDLIEKTLGEAQTKQLFDHVRDEEGNVPIEPLCEEVAEIYKVLGENVETKK